MLGCNNIFQQHLCKLGQLRRSNGRNSQVLGQAMKKRPTGHYKKYSHLKGRDTAPTTSSREGSCIVDSSTSGERAKNLWPAGHSARRTRTILSRDRTENEMFVYTALPIHLPMNQHTHSHHRESYSKKWYSLKDTGPLRVLGLLLLFMVCGLCFGCVFCCYYLFVLCCFVCCYEDS